MSIVVKRDLTVTWRGRRIGVVERLNGGWKFTADANPNRPMHAGRRRDIVIRLANDLVAAERKRTIDFANCMDR